LGRLGRPEKRCLYPQQCDNRGISPEVSWSDTRFGRFRNPTTFRKKCHQGTVYSGSFPTLPFLADVAESWQPDERILPLSLAVSIVTSTDVKGSREVLIEPYSDVVKRLETVALETLALPDLSRDDYLYLMQSALGFLGSGGFLVTQLDRLIEGELEGVCPECEADVCLIIGEDGFLATTHDTDDTDGGCDINACEVGSLPETGAWLHEQSQRAVQTELSTWVLHLFGTVQCPVCSTSISVADAVELLDADA
jgi:hypothetical protein